MIFGGRVLGSLVLQVGRVMARELLDVGRKSLRIALDARDAALVRLGRVDSLKGLGEQLDGRIGLLGRSCLVKPERGDRRLPCLREPDPLGLLLVLGRGEKGELGLQLGQIAAQLPVLGADGFQGLYQLGRCIEHRGKGARRWGRGAVRGELRKERPEMRRYRCLEGGDFGLRALQVIGRRQERCVTG